VTIFIKEFYDDDDQRKERRMQRGELLERKIHGKFVKVPK